VCSSDLDTFVRHSIDWDSQQNDYAHTSREFKIGSKVLAERIKEIEPKLVCFGHCHENGGQTVEIDGTIYVNGAVLNENYEIDNEPVIVNLEL
jgi:Icc-related predicted phosphoesterase